jgi:hypothetical protein
VEDAIRIAAIGTTQIAAGEDADAELGLWERALAHADARARKIAAVSGLELGKITAIEEDLSRDEGSNQLVLRVTYSLNASSSGRAKEPASKGAPEDDDGSILPHVDVDVRPVYDEFRQRLLEAEPRLRAAAAPLRKGKRRYEGFRVQSRNVIYAEPRKGAVRLKFELPEGHALSPDEFVRNHGHDWRIVFLSSEHSWKARCCSPRRHCGDSPSTCR